MTAYEAVLFDMDGVTVETAGAWQELERTEILPAATGDASAADAIRALSVSDAYDRLEEMESVDLNVSAAAFDRLYDERAETVYGQRAQLMDRYKQFLAELRGVDVRVGLVSASKREWVELVLDRFGLWDVYDTIVSSSDIDGPSKPDPTIYLAGATELGVDPEDCLAVEDSRHGVEAATAAGMYCLALRGDGNRTADLSAADVIVGSPRELRETVRTVLGVTAG